MSVRLMLEEENPPEITDYPITELVILMVSR